MNYHFEKKTLSELLAIKKALNDELQTREESYLIYFGDQLWQYFNSHKDQFDTILKEEFYNFCNIELNLTYENTDKYINQLIKKKLYYIRIIPAREYYKMMIQKY